MSEVIDKVETIAEKPVVVEKEVPTGPVDKRVYIGGLHAQVTEDQIQERFSRYGKVTNVTVAKNTDNECRGFAHMSIHTTPKQWETCLSVYNGAKWKGQELKLEESKMDWQEKRKLALEKIKEQEEKKRKRLLRWNDSEGFHAKDMTPVTDNNMGTRKGWKRGRYGRAIAVMRLKKNDGTKFVFEPTHYKNNLTKLFNIGVRMKPVSQLITKIDGESSDEDEEANWPKLRPLPKHEEDENMDYNYNDDEEEEEYDQNRKLTDDQKRRAAMDKMFEQQAAKKELINKALAAQSNNHTTFNNDNEDDEDKVDDAFNMNVDEEETTKTPAEAKRWMFDSDEEESDSELNININPVLEGEAGRKRLELQKKFKGDDRFKLGEDFIDEAEKNIKKKDLGDEITQELGAEKNQAMDVLNAMFGERRVDPKVQPRNTAWATPARFDPEADDSSKYLADKPEEQVAMAANEQSDNEDEDELLNRPKKAESAIPVVSTAKHFEVNTNLKPLFGDAEEAPFTLFGGDDNAPVENKPLFGSKPDVDFSSNFTPKKAEGRLGLGVLFFFHLDDPSLKNKSCYDYDPEGVFQQKLDERDAYETKWRTQRPIIKEVLKKRQKNAAKNQKKRSNRDLK